MVSGEQMAVSEETLNGYRLEGILVRVVRDADEKNDVIGTVVAWNEDTILIRKRNRRVVKLSRRYRVIPADAPRISPVE